MRFLSTLASACALPLLLTPAALAAADAAAASSAQRFDDFRRLAQLSPTIKLNEASFKSLTAAPRDYSVGVLLTALDSRFGCQLCADFQPEWELLGRTWQRGDKKADARFLLSTLDFADGRDVFLKFGLQTAPVLFFFPPTTGPHAAASPEPLRYDFTSGAPVAEQVHHWIIRQLPGRPHPEIKRPINYVRWALGITFLAGFGTLAATAGPYVLPILQNRNLWAAGTMIAILLFISGHMFNHIRKVPYVSGDGRGGITYFSGGFQNQLGLETQIVAAMYGLLSFSSIALGTRIPRITTPRSQLAAAVSWVAIMFLLNSFLLRVFRIKNGGYPFALPPFM